MKYDISAIGEILIDFAPAGKDDAGDAAFVRKAGGAPLNMLATVSKFGGKTAFIGKVGKDMFGEFLAQTLDSAGVDGTYLKVDNERNTTLAFVALDDTGDRSFSFYRNFGADAYISKDDVDPEMIRASRIFHFGSLSLTNPICKEATRYALDTAKESGAIISFDPNYRAPLWTCEREAVDAIKEFLPYADILKVSVEEAQMITDKTDLLECAKLLRSYGCSVILITDGPNGAYYYYQDNIRHTDGIKLSAVDTTGAGDIFFGTFLFEFIKSKKNIGELNENDLAEFCKKAVRISGYSVLKKGAIPSIPDYNI